MNNPSEEDITVLELQQRIDQLETQVETILKRLDRIDPTSSRVSIASDTPNNAKKMTSEEQDKENFKNLIKQLDLDTLPAGTTKETHQKNLITLYSFYKNENTQQEFYQLLKKISPNNPLLPAFAPKNK